MKNLIYRLKNLPTGAYLLILTVVAAGFGKLSDILGTGKYVGILSAVVVAWIGYLIKTIEDKNSDLRLTLSAILEKVGNGQRLNPKLIERLKKVTLESFEGWKERLRPPANSGKVDESVFDKIRDPLARIPYHMDITESRCPVSSTRNILYFNTYELSGNQYNYESAKEISALLHQRFSELDETIQLSAKLIKQYFYKIGNEKVNIWIKIPNYIITDIKVLNELFNELSIECRKWFQEFKIVTEIYLAKDITTSSGKIQFEESDLDLTLTNLKSNNWFPAVQYAIFRNIAINKLKNGAVLGQMNLPELTLPSEILEHRLRNFKNLISKRSLITLISGGPGTGKTELVDSFLQEVGSDSGKIYLICNTPVLIAFLENVNSYQSKGQFIRNLISGGKAIVPSEFSGDDLVVKSFLDAFESIIYNLEIPICLVIDDLDSFGSLKSIILQKFKQLNEWGIYLILISRSNLKEIAENFKIHCSSWSISESKQILRSWNSPFESLDESFQVLINQNEAILSSYLLRILARRNDKDKTIDTMLREELNEILEPFQFLLNNSVTSAEQRLADLKAMLANNISHEAILDALNENSNISLINLFSNLAWHSKFNIDANNISEYQSGLINFTTIKTYIKITEEQAKKFITECINSKIMAGNEDYAYWQDNLVADGCIALDLKNNIRQKKDIEVLGSKINRLIEMNSLDFFRFIQDAGTLDSLFVLLNSAGSFNPIIVEKLISNDFIHRLSNEHLVFDRVINSIYNYCGGVSFEKRLPLVRTLSKFYPYSQFLKQKCHDSISRNYQIELPLTILSGYLPKDEFFTSLRKDVSHFDLINVATSFWDTDGMNILTIEFLEEYHVAVFEQSFACWTNWCNRLNINSAFCNMKAIIDFLDSRTTGKPDYYKIANKMIEALINRVKLLCQEKAILYATVGHEIRSYLNNVVRFQISKVENETRASENIDFISYRKIFLNTITKSLGYLYSREIFSDLTVEIKIIRNNNDYIAIPLLSKSKRSLASVLSLIHDGYPLFRLAKANELLDLDIEESELISDKFPSDFDYAQNYRMAGHDFKLWNGKNIIDIESTDLTSKEFTWRPVFIIPHN